MTAHEVSFIYNYQVPFLRVLELVLQIIIARKLIHAGNQVILSFKGVSRARGIDSITGQQIKVETKFIMQLVLPLFRQ